MHAHAARSTHRFRLLRYASIITAGAATAATAVAAVLIRVPRSRTITNALWCRTKRPYARSPLTSAGTLVPLSGLFAAVF
jgi:hypothetical protein